MFTPLPDGLSQWCKHLGIEAEGPLGRTLLHTVLQNPRNEGCGQPGKGAQLAQRF